MPHQERRIDPLDLESNVAVGVALPLANPKGGGFALNYTTLEQAKTNLRSLLKTNGGERYMQPFFGADLHSVLFEQNTDVLIEQLKNKINEAVEYWLPYVTIKTLEVSRKEHTINLNINFIINENEWDVASITLKYAIPEGS